MTPAAALRALADMVERGDATMASVSVTTTGPSPFDRYRAAPGESPAPTVTASVVVTYPVDVAGADTVKALDR